MKPIKIRGVNKEFEVTVLPEGSYELSIIKVDEKPSSKNNDMLVVDFAVLSGDYASKTFRNWFPVMPETYWKLLRFVEAADPNCEVHELIETGEKDNDGNEITQLLLEDPSALVGFNLIADCFTGEDDKGRPRTEMGNMYPMESEEEAAEQAAPPPAPLQQTTINEQVAKASQREDNTTQVRRQRRPRQRA